MAHEIAKLLLEHAETFLERTEAIKSALSLGMPLNEIEDYLDWHDSVRGKKPPVEADVGQPSGEASSTSAPPIQSPPNNASGDRPKPK